MAEDKNVEVHDDDDGDDDDASDEAGVTLTMIKGLISIIEIENTQSPNIKTCPSEYDQTRKVHTVKLCQPLLSIFCSS